MELALYTSASGAGRQAALRKNSLDSDLQTAHSLLSILLSPVYIYFIVAATTHL